MTFTNGFIHHYYIAGPVFTDFIADKTDKNQIRYEQYLRSIVADRDQPAPAGKIIIGELSELGLPWEYYYPSSGFVNVSQFSYTPQKVELLAATCLVAQEDIEVQAIVWTYTALDVWLDGEKICSVHEPVYKPIKKQPITLNLTKGQNTLLIRMQNLAVRDTRNIFGIQLLEHLEKIESAHPDAGNAQPFLDLENWLAGIELKGNKLYLPQHAPCRVYLSYDDDTAGSAGIEISSENIVDINERATLAVIHGEIQHRTMSRKIELLAHKKPTYRKLPSLEATQRDMFDELAELGTDSPFRPLRFGLFYVLARWNSGNRSEHDEAHIIRAIEQIERREDCSDFHLAGLLRLMRFHSLPEDISARARQAILNYRYWMTEKGSDGMCFWSENHALMFYICAYMAGEMYPEKHFPRSDRTGLEVNRVARHRIRQWLADVEEYGFEEFLSADYMCVTLGALLNVVDFAEEESSRASGLIDLMLKSFACHAFRGSIVAPQARIYRSVILPFTQSAQALIHLLNNDTPVGNSEWIVFLMKSRYQLPYHYASLMEEPMKMEYPTGNAYVKLTKHRHYMLTSVQSPRYDERPSFWENNSFVESVDIESNDYIKSFNERFHGTSRFEPGVYGYQQHMWYAALDNDTVVFTNHPGEMSDDGGMRPGYWYGNGVMPAIKQQDNRLGVIYEIGEEHPIAFTHLFFPSAKFHAVAHVGNWLFGQKDGGYVAIWCSDALLPHHDRLIDCEYRAYGRRMAYLCECASREEFATLDPFIAYCQQLQPAFDSYQLRLYTADGYSLTAKKCDNITQYI
ncbi:hypothetical protein FHS18_006570 [Paenibacillus phyllosphaerae]|uniref:Uncharacterized protein n=1 Tax=Paenibacillus phyllosphaerae TaxID=274593 RepID=A0A7W5FRX4_9BACL|nr:hypothetical protein [Paenibacillus phyllosphaerae]MBB3114449.1 hypothetical protein [Paenibacillus phyllosphaerae]